MPVVFRSTLRPFMIGLIPALAVVVPTYGQSSPRSMSDCERLKNDLAYNQCLAMFGPAAKNIAAGDASRVSIPSSVPAPAADRSAMAGIPDVEEPELTEPGRRGRRGRQFRSSQARSGGRQSASFDIGSSDAGTADIQPEHRSRYRWRRRR